MKMKNSPLSTPAAGAAHPYFRLLFSLLSLPILRRYAAVFRFSLFAFHFSFFIFHSSLFTFSAFAQWDRQPWQAYWLQSGQPEPVHSYGVHLFRKTFSLAQKPEQFRVLVSADQRYELFVNGERVALGPGRGDLFHWKYDTIDLARWLQPGKNAVAAVVWGQGEDTPLAQMTSGHTRFILQGETPASQLINTDTTWRWKRNEALSPISFTFTQQGERYVVGYYVAGPGDRVEAARYPWAWEQTDYDDSGWQRPGLAGRGSPRPLNGSGIHMLVPTDIAQVERRPQRIPSLRTSTLPGLPASFPKTPTTITFPANRRDTLLLDQTVLTTGYAELLVSRGKGATITLKYAEALYYPADWVRDKGNRNEVTGKKFVGYYDQFLPDGGECRLFRPLNWRTWRYLQLIVETKEEPLELLDIRGEYSAYPFQNVARLKTDQPWLDKVMEVGDRTARLCANENYMDCPYYEQLQYAGDVRIQCLVAYYNYDDDRLARQAIRAMFNSRQPEGFTASRYPSQLFQIIPTYSLYWIGMVYDFWWYRNDPDFVKEMLVGTRSVLDFFHNHTLPDGTLTGVGWWNFFDWSASFKRGVPDFGKDGRSAHMDLLHLHALQMAAELEEGTGSAVLARQYRERAAMLMQTIRQLYWDQQRGLFADVTTKDQFSQHVNAMAVLTGVADRAGAADLMRKTLAGADMALCTIYFKYYLYLAAAQAGLANEYLSWLDEWKTQLGLGLTTWAEKPEPSRSDCHAWGCSPSIELFRTVLGIDSDAPGFAKVRIRPALGPLKKAEATINHPNGTIEVRYELNRRNWQVAVRLPEGISGTLEWEDGKTYPLQPGAQTLTLENRR